MKISDSTNVKITTVLKTCDRISFHSKDNVYHCLRCAAAS